MAAGSQPDPTERALPKLGYFSSKANAPRGLFLCLSLVFALCSIAVCRYNPYLIFFQSYSDRLPPMLVDYGWLALVIALMFFTADAHFDERGGLFSRVVGWLIVVSFVCWLGWYGFGVVKTNGFPDQNLIKGLHLKK